jgi:hypothetical protein
MDLSFDAAFELEPAANDDVQDRLTFSDAVMIKRGFLFSNTIATNASARSICRWTVVTPQ